MIKRHTVYDNVCGVSTVQLHHKMMYIISVQVVNST